MISMTTNFGKLTAAAGALALCTALAGCDGKDGNGGSTSPSPTRTPTSASATNTPGAGATATPTRPSSGPTATATATGAPNQQELKKVEAVIASVIPSVLDLQSFGGLAGGGVPRSARTGLPPITAPCPAGGNLKFSCDSSGGGSRTEIDFNTCKIGATGVPTTTIDGLFAQTIQAPCFSPPPANGALGIEFRGTINTTDPSNGQPLTFTLDMGMTIQQTSSGTRLDFDGSVDTDCVGRVQVKTLETITIPNGGSCPTAGRIRVTVSGVNHEVRYTSSGGVQIDLKGDGTIDDTLASCQDADEGSC